MSIDNDEYFIGMIQAAWKLNPSQNYSKQKAWVNEIGHQEPKRQGRTLGERNQIVGNSKNAPFGTDDEPTSYATSNNPTVLKGKAMQFSKKGDDVTLKFRDKMSARGTRGIILQ